MQSKMDMEGVLQRLTEKMKARTKILDQQVKAELGKMKAEDDLTLRAKKTQ